jgi:hypothetical protein
LASYCYFHWEWNAYLLRVLIIEAFANFDFITQVHCQSHVTSYTTFEHSSTKTQHPARTSMPAYLIAEHIITDSTKFKEYRIKVGL